MTRTRGRSPSRETNQAPRGQLRRGTLWRWLAVSAVSLIAAGVVLTNPSAPARPRAARAQNQPSAGPPDPPGTIDGAKNPELIPDDVAYRLLFLAVAEPDNATEEQKARARAKIRAANLREEDVASFLGVASEFRNQVDSLAAQAAKIRGGIPLVHPDSVVARQLSQLEKQEDQVLANTIGIINNTLTQEGSRKLQAHIQSIKRDIKLFPFPPNMPVF